MRGLFENHVRKCSGQTRRSASDKEVPVVPLSLMEMYHGATGDTYDVDPDYDEGPELKRARYLFQEAPDGFQELNFHEVCLEMEKDPEAAVPAYVVPGGNGHFQCFQKKLVAKASSSNPLDFRRTEHGRDMDNLWNIYAFVREFRLSSLAGLLTYMYISMYISMYINS